MSTEKLSVERFRLTSSKSFEDVLAAIDAAIGHPDMKIFQRDITAASTPAELENIIHKVIGPSGLMEFLRFDLGEYLRKESGKTSPKIVRIVAGNPLIMKQMVQHVPDAGSYAPVTILIDQRFDGVHLSYDRMASFLVSYGSSDALKVARDLDSKVESLLTAAAR
jgi:uncharacterized protein (DUF302 family)